MSRLWIEPQEVQHGPARLLMFDANVEHDEIRLAISHFFVCAGALDEERDLVPLRLEQFLHEAKEGSVVVDDRDMGHELLFTYDRLPPHPECGSQGVTMHLVFQVVSECEGGPTTGKPRSAG